MEVEAGRATDFRGLPSSARGFLFPSDQVREAATPRAWASKHGKLESLSMVVYGLLVGFPRATGGSTRYP